MKDCRLKGRQDTLFCGPLPKAPRIPGSFIGPSKGRIRKQHTQYFVKCTIEGDVDFVFGSSKAYFINCKFISLDRHEACNGYVFAPSTYPESKHGFMIIDGEFIGEEGIGGSTCYLARPWRPHGMVELINCQLGDHIHDDLWDYWGDVKNKETARFLKR